MAQASAEKLEHTGPAEKERVASVPQRELLVSTPEPSLPKGKGTEPSVQSTISRGRRVSTWEHKEERVDSTVNESRFQGGEGGKARRASLREIGRNRESRGKHEQVSGRKSSAGRSAECWFHS